MAFQGEVLATMHELEHTHATLLEVQGQLASVQQENAALVERCNEFVRANLDHMLAWRSLKAKADALESEFQATERQQSDSQPHFYFQHHNCCPCS
jgi:predicted nuclease with TOPRIM domain